MGTTKINIGMQSSFAMRNYSGSDLLYYTQEFLFNVNCFYFWWMWQEVCISYRRHPVSARPHYNIEEKRPNDGQCLGVVLTERCRLIALKYWSFTWQKNIDILEEFGSSEDASSVAAGFDGDCLLCLSRMVLWITTRVFCCLPSNSRSPFYSVPEVFC